jgi:hypothetical protein
VNRREFLAGTTAFVATAALPQPVLTQAKDDIEALRAVTTTYRPMDGRCPPASSPSRSSRISVSLTGFSNEVATRTLDKWTVLSTNMELRSSAPLPLVTSCVTVMSCRGALSVGARSWRTRLGC